MIVQRQPPTAFLRLCIVYIVNGGGGGGRGTWFGTWRTATGCITIHQGCCSPRISFPCNSFLFKFFVKRNLCCGIRSDRSIRISLRRNVRINTLTIGLPADRIVDPKVDRVRRGLPLSMYEMYICTYDRTYRMHEPCNTQTKCLCIPREDRLGR